MVIKKNNFKTKNTKLLNQQPKKESSRKIFTAIIITMVHPSLSTIPSIFDQRRSRSSTTLLSSSNSSSSSKKPILRRIAGSIMLIASILLVSRNLIITSSASSSSSDISSSSKLILRGGSSSSYSNNGSGSGSEFPKYRTVQVQIIHRHGDRTPITSMKDEDFWSSTLIPPEWLDKIAEGTVVVRHQDEEEQDKSSSATTSTANTHKAQGRGPFGKLTQVGLFQMVNVGNQLREELYSPSDHVEYQLQQDDDDDHGENGQSDGVVTTTTTTTPQPYWYHGQVWSPSRPIHPHNIKVLSTDFARTIQSVQGVLVGLFPDGIIPTTSNSGGNNGGESTTTTIPIDCRTTNHWMIPDPQPRQSEEQVTLESILASRSYIVQRDQEIYPLAVRTTNAIRDLLGDDAFDMSFGVGEDQDQTQKDQDSNKKPLPFSQLAEILKCLSVRNKLPITISQHDSESIMKHLAWKWFETLRHPRLSYLAMNQFTMTILSTMYQHQHYYHYQDNNNNENKENVPQTQPPPPPVILYSAHDSTLIGLLCAFQLERPAIWPEYASYMKIELLEVISSSSTSSTSSSKQQDHSKTEENKKEYVVRFSLNGKLLRSQWNGKSRAMIPLNVLTNHIKTEGAVKV